MKLLRNETEMSTLCGQWRRKGFKIGFVPTMGALHEGHLKLVEAAISESEKVAVSIFVNPSQFGSGEDLDKYPRNLMKDCALLEKLGVDAVFAPDPETVYPMGFSTRVSVSGVTGGLCGEFRPGHFDGVTTVCAVLFGIVKPHTAVFGMKDAQQLAVIKTMVRDLRLGIEIVAVPIIRETDGLAMSSRNAYLSQEERTQARAINRGLQEVLALSSRGETNCRALRETFMKFVDSQQLLRVQYAETVDPDTMEAVEEVRGPVLLAVAVFAGKTRLIDNVLIEPED